ncbi:MAG: NAD(P)-dependent glycerol-3-phosphate dehydrogenase [Mailhella sp.]|nr:NAD(P)-dependent glycerol-3-phosphate dehydrogenase [Mailhella sp.]
MDNSTVTVWGGGSWGTALAVLLARGGRRVSMIVRREEQAREIGMRHRNEAYLPGVVLPDGISATTEVGGSSGIVVLSIPVQLMRGALAEHRGSFPDGTVFINTSKGFEQGTLLRPFEIVRETLGSGVRYATLSGPSFAAEVAADLPTAVSLACEDAETGGMLCRLFSSGRFRAYSTQDVPGVETGGAVKNVIAIAAGLSDGLGFGLNTRAALVTRGIAEITRLGLALGAYPETFRGLSGRGDLMLTCTGDLSRSRRTGLRLAAGESLESITASLGHVAEGVKTSFAVRALAERHGVDMPITSAVTAVLSGSRPPMECVKDLFMRPIREESV